ncbi:MAG: MBL fold metallo-hydrolase [Proteobacteria bacterium]|nr:MBL fold metallo-hydrolase [Pseudomonadota bacterium]
MGRKNPLDKNVFGKTEQLAPGVHLVPGFGNSTVFVGSDGIAVVDPGLFLNGPRLVAEIRRLSEAPIRYIIYTHGHFDHAFGTGPLMADAEKRGFPKPEIIGHVNLAKRFRRYAKTAGHLVQTYAMQFTSWSGGDLLPARTTAEAVVLHAKYFFPTLEYEDRLAVSLGDLTVECRHGKGETDDHTWVWVPERSVVVGGDFVVASMPNAGTPFRVQRYVLEWAEALEEMASLLPEFVVSGHGQAFKGAVAHEMLLVTAKALRFLEDEVIRRLNDGQWDEQILNEVDLPEELKQHRYLQPLYGCPTFAVQSILRRYKGWYDGNPTNIFPSPKPAVAAEVVALVGGVEPLIERARQLAESGELKDIQLALHLLDFVIDHSGDSLVEAYQFKARLLESRAKVEVSFIARNIFRAGAALAQEASTKG